jgi:sulfate/thiosulfate-binding protein
VQELLRHAPVLDSGGRGATITFTERGQGDVLLAWENEAFLAQQEKAEDGYQIVIPSLSILAEPPVAVIDAVVDRRGTRKVAEAYLNFLYTPQGQELAAKHGYRPRLPEIVAKYADHFPKLNLVTIADFGGWKAAQAKFFADNGVFDQIYTPGK